MTTAPVRNTFVTVMVVLTVIMSSGPAARNSAFAEDVRVTVYAIEASNGVPGIDPEIRSIVEQFEGAFRYSTYKLVSKMPKNIGIGQEEKFSLPGQREMRVFVRGYQGNRIKLNVKIVEKKDRSREVLSTDLGIVDGGTMIIGGYHHRDGKLMVAVSAEK